MNLLIFLDLSLKFYSLQGQNVQIFLIFTYNQGKIFLILPITGEGGTCIPGLHQRSPPPRSNKSKSNLIFSLLFLSCEYNIVCEVQSRDQLDDVIRWVEHRPSVYHWRFQE